MTGTDPAEPDIAPVPDTSGHFLADGVAYGVRFAPEALMAALDELAAAYEQARNDPAFTAELDGMLKGYAGRPTLLTQARRFGAAAGGAETAVAARVAYSHSLWGHTFTAGLGGYYSREYWGFKRNVNGYAATADWELPLSRQFTLSGFFYRGQAIGGLGAALSRSVFFNGPLTDPATEVQPLNSAGGWAQLKYQPLPKLEFNAAFGLDNPFAADVRYFGYEAQSYGDPYVTRNQGWLGNVIYRPRSDLLLSLEYHRLKTFSIFDNNWAGGQLNMAMGILF